MLKYLISVLEGLTSVKRYICMAKCWGPGFGYKTMI